MKKSLLILLAISLSLALAVAAVAQQDRRITKDELLKILDNPDVVILDVRLGKDWDASEFKIKGAIRKDPLNIDKWAGEIPKNKTIVLYCA
jgi:rhodanese-related sulfurtransferase